MSRNALIALGVGGGLFLLFRKRRQAEPLTGLGSWPQADIFKLDRPPTPPSVTLRRGTAVWHGSKTAFDVPRAMTWFATSERDAKYFAEFEVGGEKVAKFTTKKRLKLLRIPNVKSGKAYDNAIFWAKAIFGVSFAGIGFQRMPAAFKAVCKTDFDGIMIDKEDSGFRSIMICDGRNLERVRR